MARRSRTSRVREHTLAVFPWRVEADVYASDVVARLPSSLRAPHVYLVDELGDDRIRIWMEDVATVPVVWDLERYAAAAYALG